MFLITRLNVNKMKIQQRHTVMVIALLLGMIFSYNTSKAQNLFRGVVTDAESGEPVELANVQLLFGEKQRLIDYTLTDAEGRFSLPAGKGTNEMDSLFIVVSLLGYEPVKTPVNPPKIIAIPLSPKAFSLREVEVRPGRVWGRQDTINYEVSQFLSARDNSIRDVIKKLPGVDVDDLGRITYNGREISNFYVEGMDVTDGRYGQINNNLDPRAVEKVQLLENHQPIRLLKDKVKTEDIAINLKLREDFRDKWMVTLQGGPGISHDPSVLWEANLHALQLSRKNQSVYSYKSNNTGNDITEEMADLSTSVFTRTPEPVLPFFLKVPSLEAPLKKEKMLFNHTHTLSGNRIYKVSETARLRVNTFYIHDRSRQERGSITTWFQPNDTLQIAENSRTRFQSDQAEVRLTLEDNADSHYLNNRFSTSGTWNTASSRFQTEELFNQSVRRKELLVKNDFKTNWNRGKNTYEVQSFLRYAHLPGKLAVDQWKERMPLDQFYTDNSFSIYRKKGNITHQYKTGLRGEINNIHNRYDPYFIPSWQWGYRKWQVWLNSPVVWTSYPGIDFSRVMANPSLTLRYKYNYAWNFSLHANFQENYGTLIDLYDSAYRTDYLHTVQNNGILPIRRFQNYSLYGEYKNTIKEFFASLRIGHFRNWSNQTYEQVVEPEQITTLSHHESNQGYNWTIRGTLSKSFYDWHLKTSLDYQFVRQKAEMISQGQRLPYHSDYMLYEPKITWSPNRRWDASYQGNFRYGGNRIGDNELTPLWNIVQKLSVSYDLFPVELTLSADHYYNDISRDQSMNSFFFDTRIRWKTGTWQFDCTLTNLFDKQQYSYTQYTALHSYTSWIDIRGRELLVTARYKF